MYWIDDVEIYKDSSSKAKENVPVEISATYGISDNNSVT